MVDVGGGSGSWLGVGVDAVVKVGVVVDDVLGGLQVVVIGDVVTATIEGEVGAREQDTPRQKREGERELEIYDISRGVKS